MTYWSIRDPQGWQHRVMLEGGEFFGVENLYHDIPRRERAAYLNQMMAALYARRDLPAGFILEDYHA